MYWLIKRYIFQLTKCEQKGVSKSIDSDEGSFSSVKSQQIFLFFLKCNILFRECSKKDRTYISDTLTLFAYKLRIKTKSKYGNEDDLDLFLNGSNFIRME